MPTTREIIITQNAQNAVLMSRVKAKLPLPRQQSFKTEAHKSEFALEEYCQKAHES